jgi:hypothetical protein
MLLQNNPVYPVTRRLELVLIAAADREAVAESKLAYDFIANSYSYSAMNACMGAERALDVLQDALEGSGD